MLHKLRRRFVVIAMVCVTLVIVLLSLSINVVNFVSTNADLGQMLDMIYANEGMMPQFPDEKRPTGGRNVPISPETPYSTRYFVLRYTPDGTLLQANLRSIAAVSEEDADKYVSIALAHGEGYGYTGHYKYYVGAVDGGYMAVFLDCQQELHAVRVFALVSCAVALICIALVFLLIVFFSKRATDPVLQSVEKQKQFITDASHELKTPLTVIVTSLKVLEMEVGQQKWIDKALNQADHMKDLVNDLVTLSRLDEERPALRLADFNISEAALQTAESFQDFAQAQGKTLELAIQPEVTYRGDEYAIRQLLSVLLDNAVKYSDPEGVIRLSLEREKRGVMVRTCNTCEGFDPAELERLFDRFYRVEKSRSKQGGGFGVGLSIARSIAEAHRGSIKAECPRANVIQFTVFLRA
jgi:signal transduction histidine kinase